MPDRHGLVVIFTGAGLIFVGLSFLVVRTGSSGVASLLPIGGLACLALVARGSLFLLFFWFSSFLAVLVVLVGLLCRLTSGFTRFGGSLTRRPCSLGIRGLLSLRFDLSRWRVVFVRSWIG